MNSKAAEKLEFFTSSISADASALAKKIMDEIQAESKQALSAAEDEYLNETYRYIKNEISRIRTEMRRNVSQKMLENKRTLSALQRELFAEVSSITAKRIEDYTATQEYFAALVASLKRICESFGGSAVQVFLRPADMKAAEQLQKALPGCKLEFKESDFKLGGLLCQCAERQWQVDDTFDSRFSELERRFSELLGLRLASGSVN